MPRQFRQPIDRLPTPRAEAEGNLADAVRGRVQDRAIDNVMDRTLQYVCDFRRANPSLFSRVTGSTPPLSFSLPYARNMFWNAVCEPYDEGANPPTPPARGGQCPVPYKLFVNAIQALTGTQVGDQVGTITLVGPVIDARFERTVTAPFGVNQYSYILYITDSQVGVTQPKVTWTYPASPFDLASYSYRIERVDGLPDSCGDPPPPEFPATAPVWVSPISIQFGDQEIEVNARIGGPDIDNYPDFTFDPTVVLEGLGEVSISFPDVVLTLPDWPDTPEFPDNNPPTSITDLGDLINSVNTSVNNSVNEINNNTNSIGDTIVNVINETCGDETNFDEIKALIRCVCGNENASFTLQVLSGDSPGDYFDIPERTRYVTFEHLGDIEPGTRSQNGSGDAPNVFYWGWCAVCYDNRIGGVRSELHYLDQAIPVGEFATGIIFNPTFGNRGRVVAHIQELCE